MNARKNTVIVLTLCNRPDYTRRVLESGHIMYRHYLDTKLDEQIREHIRLADHVTTTTEHLAQKIRLLNKKVTILPNEPYEAYQQYLPDTNAEPEPHLFKIG